MYVVIILIFKTIFSSVIAGLVQVYPGPSQANNDQFPLLFDEVGGIVLAHHSKMLLLLGTVTLNGNSSDPLLMSM